MRVTSDAGRIRQQQRRAGAEACRRRGAGKHLRQGRFALLQPWVVNSILAQPLFLIILIALSLILVAPPTARGQDCAAANGENNPFGQYEEVSCLAKEKGYKGIKTEIKSALSSPARNIVNEKPLIPRVKAG